MICFFSIFAFGLYYYYYYYSKSVYDQ